MVRKGGLPKKIFNRPKWTAAVLLVIAVFGAVGVYAIMTYLAPPSAKVGVVRIDGTLTWDHVSQIESAVHDSSLKAVVLQVNSPGGSVSASFGVEQAVSDLASEKPVVAELEQIAASGAYLAVSPSNFIYAHEDTITGGLGVIAIWVSYEEYFEEQGIDYYIWSSGEQKDLFAPWRGPTEEENATIQEWIESLTDEMFNRIVANRPEVENFIDDLSDARTVYGYDEDQLDALDYKLVDAVGDIHYATEKAADLAGLEEGEYRVVNFP